MQRGGTLFSGYRGTAQARAEHPYVQAMADLDVNTPLQLEDLYEQATNTLQDYTINQNLLLADAANRQAGIISRSTHRESLHQKSHRVRVVAH
jgi:hypothetical protein